jgi:hypothetical protein
VFIQDLYQEGITNPHPQALLLVIVVQPKVTVHEFLKGVPDKQPIFGIRVARQNHLQILGPALPFCQAPALSPKKKF